MNALEASPIGIQSVLLVLAGMIVILLVTLIERQRVIRRLRKTLAHAGSECSRIRAELQRFAAVVNQAAEAVMITDAENRIVYVNPAFIRLTGYTLLDLAGKTPRLFRTDRHDEAFYRKLNETLHAGKSWKGTFTNRCKDGTLLELDTIISPVHDDQHRILHYVSAARDMTYEHQLERQLRHAQKTEAIGTLAGGIAHDFNNILSAIIGYTELGLLDVAPGTSVEESLRHVLKASKRAADLVAQILTFSRRRDHERQPLLLGPIVKESLQLLRGTLPSTIEIRQSIAGNLPPVMADTTQMHQIMMNLCTNASHAMRTNGGILDVSLRTVTLDERKAPWQIALQAGAYVELAVSDTGHGMTPDIMSRIFEPYFTTKHGADGTGLGLATVHGIVSLHEGAIHVESVPGQGSVFTILLPACPPDLVIPGLSSEEQRLQHGSNQRILVVDDEESIAKMIETTLSWLGYQVESFTSSVKALESFKSDPGRFDAVITDQTMPTLPGIDLARRILEIRPGIPIILCSGYSDSINADGAKAAGIREYVMKPAAGKALASVLQRLFHQNADATA